MNTINTPVSEAEESEDEHSVQNRLKASINDYIEKKKSVILNDSKSSSRSQSVEDREDRDKTAKTPLKSPGRQKTQFESPDNVKDKAGMHLKP